MIEICEKEKIMIKKEWIVGDGVSGTTPAGEKAVELVRWCSGSSHAYGSFSIIETFTDKFLYWFPLYYHVKFAFLVWLQLPCADGAKQLYMNHLRPFLMRHQARLDHILGLFHGELAKFISTHQAEIQFAKVLLAKILLPVGNILQPAQGRVVGTIEGPAEQVETSESEDES